jgi:imidazolonepropionase-like amidohydrolase
MIVLATWPGFAAAQRPGNLNPQVREFVVIDTPLVALRNVRVIDGTGARPRDDQTVLIRNGSIVSVGPALSVAVPEGARILSLPGHTVLPGIVALHNHLGFGRDLSVQQEVRLYLGAGVTTLRTTGTREPYRDLNLKRDIDESRYPGPTIYVTAPYLTGPGPQLRMAQVARPEDARRFVNHWADEGVTWIKVYTRIRQAELAAAIAAAHARGLRVTGHLCAVTARDAAELGIDNIEHGPLSTDFSPDKSPDICPQAGGYPDDPASQAVEATLRVLVTRNVAITATLPEVEAVQRRVAAADPRVFDFMSPTTVAVYRNSRAELDAAPETFQRVATLLRSFVEAGGLLAAGTDPVFRDVLPGLSDQRNYELLVHAGFAPQQAVKIMTSNGAEVLGVSSLVGTLEPGKVADLVVIRGNPVSDPTAIRQVVFVFKKGIGYDAPRLIESVRRELSFR